MRILAIDTATEACSAALWNDGTLSAHFEICPREHTQRILPLVQDVLNESATRVLAAIDARMGEVYWAEYQRDEQGVWHGEESEAVLKPEAVRERLQRLEGEWATVGTGWQAWPDLANGCGLTLVDGDIQLPEAQDMLPLACHLFTAGKTVAVEHAEPVYLRNEVAWKKLPGRE